jgi:hypothetical protein
LDVNESKLRNGEVENIENLAIDFGLVLGLDFGAVTGFACAAFRVEVINQLTEDDTQERERNTGGDGEDQTSDREQDIEFDGVDLDIDRKVPKDFLKLFVNNKLALDHDTQDLHEAYLFDNPGARFGGDKSAMVAIKCLAGRHQL